MYSTVEQHVLSAALQSESNCVPLAEARWLLLHWARQALTIVENMGAQPRGYLNRCEQCGRWSPASQHNRRFCSNTCRMRASRGKAGAGDILTTEVSIHEGHVRT